MINLDFEKQDLIDAANKKYENTDINIYDIQLSCIDDTDCNLMTVILPYSEQEYELSFDGDSLDEMLEDIICVVNRQLDDMIDHLNDCKATM